MLINRLHLTGEGDRYSGMLYEWLDRAAPRRVKVAGSTLEMVLRENCEGPYITLINPDVHRDAVATVSIVGVHDRAIDRGMDGGFLVPLQREGETTTFDIVLSPGEGTVIGLYRTD